MLITSSLKDAHSWWLFIVSCFKKLHALCSAGPKGLLHYLCAVARMPEQNLQQIQQDPPASYIIATLGGLFFLFSGVMDVRHCQSKLSYLTLQALYSLVLNRLNTQGLVLRSLKINKPNSKLSMALPPSLPLSIHLCQPATILHFASWFSWIWQWIFLMSKFMLIPKELFCVRRH